MFADKAKKRVESRVARHGRIRRGILGTAERPRLCVRRSLSHMYAQLVDDSTGKSLVQVSTLSAEIKAKAGELSKTELSSELGKLIAEKAKSTGIAQVVFDRGGYIYHGRVKAVADAAREAGLNF